MPQKAGPMYNNTAFAQADLLKKIDLGADHSPICRRMLEFEIEQDGEVRDVVLNKQEVVIGRRNENRKVGLDLSPDDLVSRVHTRVWVERGVVMIEDLGSSGGTLLNGTAISEATVLGPSDEVVLGETHLTVKATKPARRRSGAPKGGPGKGRPRRGRPRPKPTAKPGDQKENVVKVESPQPEAEASGNTIHVEISIEGATKVQSFDRDEILIGRKHHETDISLDLSADLQVSRTHARAWQTRGICWVEDLGSTHGTRVNGAPINGACVVGQDDQVQIGSVILRFWTEGGEKNKQAVKQQGVPVTEAGEESAFQAMESYPVYHSKEDHYRYHAPGSRSRKDLEEILLSRKSPMGSIRSTHERALSEPFLRSDDATALLKVMPDLPGQFDAQQDSITLAQWLVNQLPDWLDGVQRAALFVIDPTHGRIKVMAHVPSLKPILSDTLAHRALATRTAFAWQQVGKKESVRRLSMQAGLYVPLMVGDEEVGILCVEDTTSNADFSEGQLSALILIGQLAAIHLQNRLWREAGS